MTEFFDIAVQQFQQQSLLELLAFVLSVLYVVLATRQNIWCWPCAFVGTGIFVYLFWEVTLVFQMLLNFYYIIMAVVGFLSWKEVKDKPTLSITRVDARVHILLIFVGFFATWSLVKMGENWFTGDWVWLDAGTAVFSVIATVMTARKKIDNWVYWLVINPATAYLMFQNGLYLTCALMFLYTIMSIYGFVNWRKYLT
nr:nicotinamide riboside transporter PnuC [uncultured Glaciecola sp.]